MTLSPEMETRPTIHLVNPMWDTAGSEWRTYELYRQLSPHARVRIWSTGRPSPVFTALAPIRRIRPTLLHFPWGGTIVFVGVYARIRRWIHFARPRRIILLYNTNVPEQLERQIRHVQRGRSIPIEVAYASEWLRASIGRPGPVQVSPIDLNRFTPAGHGSTKGTFTIGRLSRDTAKKHHPGDPALYQRLSAVGVRVRILGGTVLASAGTPPPGVELLPINTLQPDVFLRSLDCFYYRTSDEFREPHGRVVHEAMACGLPVVCHRNGGYADYIDHGRNGFLFDTEDEAFALLTALQQDSALRQRVGAAARATVAELFSPSALQSLVSFYTAPKA